MPAPLFRLVSVGSVLAAAPDGWAAEMLRDGDVALLVDDAGLDAVDTVARSLRRPTVPVVRREADAVAQETTVREHADGLPTVWIATGFGDDTVAWAKRRGPMTLLVEAAGPLGDEDRRRIERFISILGGQAA